jgi:hypothetical protein
VLVVDETGDVKKGVRTVGVQRQYTGTAGRIENAQVAVYLTYAAPGGYAFIDRALYLPASWTADPARCAAAGVPEGTGFATKPALARAMLARAVETGVPARWVAGDEVYGADPLLRADLAGHGLGYVLAVAATHRILTPAGTFTAAALAARVPRHAWARLSAGTGAKGHRWYDWALIDTVDVAADPRRAGQHWLLIRRHRRTGELAFYRAHAPTPVPLAELVRVAGTRWKIEEAFQIRQGAGRPGSASGPHLDLLAPPDRPGHACARVPVGHDRHRTVTRTRRRPDRPDPQRDPPPVHRRDHHPRRHPPPALVHLAPPTPGPRPHQPLPATTLCLSRKASEQLRPHARTPAGCRRDGRVDGWPAG